MDDLGPLGRLLIVAGVVLAIVGVLLVVFPRMPFLGSLPGDIRIGTRTCGSSFRSAR
jgi:Protein of unknown function (DUF2905)